jgi:hypothetical protein
MKSVTYIFYFFVLFFMSCKKNYVCECKNSNGAYIAGETEGTRNQAKNFCRDLSTGDTKCNIQQ